VIPRSNVLWNHNKLEISSRRREGCEIVDFSVSVWFPAGEDLINKGFLKMLMGEKAIITWTILQDRKYRKAIDHFSTLPYGCIPDHDVDFFKYFILSLKDKWLNLCDLARKHLTNCVSGSCEPRSIKLLILLYLLIDYPRSVVTSFLRRGKTTIS
jgi:hypothetical protein